MKKQFASILSLALALAMVFSLVGCQSNGDDDNDSKSPSQSNSDKNDNLNNYGADNEIISEIEDNDNGFDAGDDETEARTCAGCCTTSGADYIMETFTPPHNYLCLDCFTKYSVCVDCNDASNPSSYRSDFDDYYCDGCYVENQICIYCCSKDAKFYERYYFCDECYNELYGK